MECPVPERRSADVLPAPRCFAHAPACASTCKGSLPSVWCCRGRRRPGAAATSGGAGARRKDNRKSANEKVKDNKPPLTE